MPMQIHKILPLLEIRDMSVMCAGGKDSCAYKGDSTVSGHPGESFHPAAHHAAFHARADPHLPERCAGRGPGQR